MRITDAFITDIPRPMLLGMFDPMPEFIATFEDGSTKTLFSFYPDEVSFRASEFVDLTEEEAHSLFQQKDTAYPPQPATSSATRTSPPGQPPLPGLITRSRINVTWPSSADATCW